MNPSHEMNHQLTGLRYGATQASKKAATRIKFKTIKNLRRKVRNRVTINAIYPIKWSVESAAGQPVAISFTDFYGLRAFTL